MNKCIDLTGQKFGKLAVIQRIGSKDRKAVWRCRCDCENIVDVVGKDLRNGHTKSCGCLRVEQTSKVHRTHGKSKSRLFSIWQAMLKRCYRNNNKDYKRYGGRGITVCEEWLKFEPFNDWAVANGYKEGLTIDRIDTNGNYEPSNCRWATIKEQCNNRTNNSFITYNGKTQTITQWADELGINYRTLVGRVKRLHWSVEKAFTTK